MLGELQASKWVAKKSCHGQTLINECFISDYPSNFDRGLLSFRNVLTHTRKYWKHSVSLSKEKIMNIFEMDEGSALNSNTLKRNRPRLVMIVIRKINEKDIRTWLTGTLRYDWLLTMV